MTRSRPEHETREMTDVKAERDALRSERDALRAERDSLLRDLDSLRIQHQNLQNEFLIQSSSAAWSLVSTLRNLRHRLAPMGSTRDRVARFLVSVLRIAPREGIAGLVARARRRLRPSGHRSRPPAPSIAPPVSRERHQEILAAALHAFFEGPPHTLTFEKAAQPTLSVVIPTYNKAEYLLGCLQSLAADVVNIPSEVIIVDNASEEDVGALFARIDGLEVIRRPANEGFGAACNVGARRARGQYIVFLNNDCFVSKGCLAALLETAAGDSSTGMVGARLELPDGSLQEAGGIIWSDGSAQQYGRGDDPDLPQYEFVREVDYCSGACLLVRRDLFGELGGFDEMYAPAYYEDVDLSFRARAAGRKVVYQPQARAVHVEGATSGTDLAKGFKRFQVLNKAKFVRRHRLALQQQLPRGQAPLNVARDRRGGLRVLVVDVTVPRWDWDAGSLRLRRLIDILSELGHRITLLPEDKLGPQPYTGLLQSKGVEVLHGDLDHGPLLKERIGEFQLAILCRAPTASKYWQLLEKVGPIPPVILDTVDLHFLRLERRAEVEGDPEARRLAAEMRRTELDLASRVDRVWVVTESEKNLLRELLPHDRIGIVPTIHPTMKTGLPFSERRDLLFVGGFLHEPNVDAVLFFAREVFPLVVSAIPDLRLLVAGANAPRVVRELASDRVVVLGWVPDLGPVLGAARVHVAPLRFGAGLKGKIGEALAAGLPTVTTSIGSEGMGLVDRITAMIANTPENFAAKVVELYRDESLWETLVRNGRGHAEARYGQEVVRATLAVELEVATRNLRN